MLRAVQAGPTSSTGGGHLHGGQRSVSLEYQTCISAYLFDTLVTGKAEVSVDLEVQDRMGRGLNELAKELVVNSFCLDINCASHS